MGESLAEMSDESLRERLYRQSRRLRGVDDKTSKLISNVFEAIRESPIVELTTGREFASASEAAKAFGISSDMVLRSVRECVFVNHGTVAFSRKFGASLDEYVPAERPAVVEMVSGRVFNGVQPCAKQLGIDVKTIRRSIDRLVFVNEDTLAFRFINQKRRLTDYSKTGCVRKRPIMELFSGKTFDSINMASRELSISRPMIKRSLSEHCYCSNNERAFRRVDDSTPIECYRQQRHMHKQRVIELVSGQTYSSIKSASKEIGLSQTSIGRSIHDKRYINNNHYAFCYADDPVPLSEYRKVK